MKITETPSLYDALETKPVSTLLHDINTEDAKVALAVREVLPRLTELIESIIPRFIQGGRIFYLGAGTSGRLGVLDASEVPPTYGLNPDRVIALISGGDKALRDSIDKAEDDPQQAWRELQQWRPTQLDTIIGVAASGTTPYVVGAVQEARRHNITTACITNNPDTPLAASVDFPIEVITGPEFVTGSTRMKAGTAAKMLLNMITTVVMIKTGRVKGNKMINMQLTNNKLVDRGVRMLLSETSLDYDAAQRLLEKYGSVKAALDAVSQSEEI